MAARSFLVARKADFGGITARRKADSKISKDQWWSAKWASTPTGVGGEME